ncbi:MAG: type II toxin-antitoxin system VapC family toxin [bacterium]|nr:type II toxin-antitoxin system VapC family toxin [bacterium]
MLFDTDVLIWFLRGNRRAADVIQRAEKRVVSVVTYMELLQGARDKPEQRAIRAFLKDMGFRILPLSEDVGTRASVYMEEYGLRVHLCMADALLAATATVHQLPLLTGNAKHYRPIQEVDLKVFRPN